MLLLAIKRKLWLNDSNSPGYALQMDVSCRDAHAMTYVRYTCRCQQGLEPDWVWISVMLMNWKVEYFALSPPQNITNDFPLTTGNIVPILITFVWTKCICLSLWPSHISSSIVLLRYVSWATATWLVFKYTYTCIRAEEIERRERKWWEERERRGGGRDLEKKRFTFCF